MASVTEWWPPNKGSNVGDDKNSWENTTWDDATSTASKSRTTMKAMKKVVKPFVLEKVEGPGERREFVLDQDFIVVGRLPESGVRLDSNEVSRKHMLLKKIGDEYACTDMESHNGVFLNGVKIHSATLREGDTLQIGDVILIYHEGT
jgi:pSer/pThr/pTyr-binding forkhead associated (FHA) protein